MRAEPLAHYTGETKKTASSTDQKKNFLGLFIVSELRT
jgi:hypothetical protein